MVSGARVRLLQLDRMTVAMMMAAGDPEAICNAMFGIFTMAYTPSITHIAVYVDRAPTALFHHAVRLTFCVLASPPRPSGALSCGN